MASTASKSSTIGFKMASTAAQERKVADVHVIKFMNFDMVQVYHIIIKVMIIIKDTWT